MTVLKNPATVMAFAAFFVFLGTYTGDINSSLIGIDMSTATSIQKAIVKTAFYLVALGVFYEGGKLL